MEHSVANSDNNIHNTLTVPCEKSKTISFAPSTMKNIFAPSTWF